MLAGRFAQLSEIGFDRIDLALFSAGSATARQWAPTAVGAGAIVIDNSSAFRMDPTVPLVVPEIYAGSIAARGGIIANPNCAAVIAAMALWPIHRRNRIRRVILATYQAASGAGAAAMQELRDATCAFLEARTFTPQVLPHPYAFNLFSHDTPVDSATGYNDEETKVINETRKILDDPEIHVGVTCVRVPVLRAHAVAATLECERAISPQEARAWLAEAPGLRMQRTRASTEAVFLLMVYAFDILGYQRLAWRCNNENLSSLRAARRYGFKFEGTWRSAALIKGQLVDLAWHSMLAEKWPARRAAIARWLSDDNFDQAGLARTRLSHAS